jgi:uncharacterized protein (TIGR04255 family)
MDKKLSKAPVCFTLAQIHFEPSQDWGDIADVLRADFVERGYTDYQSIEEIDVQLEVGGIEGIKARRQPTTTQRHWFMNRMRTDGVMLDPAGLTYQTTNYPVFDKFTDAFLEAVEVIASRRPFDRIPRIGMRMLDAIQPSEGHEIDTYVIPATKGIAESLNVSMPVIQCVTEAVYQDDGTTLIVRTHRNQVGIAFPGDLQPLRLRLADRFLESGRPTVMLDSDAVLMASMAYDPTRLRAELSRLKALLSKCFKAQVTPYALEAWR